VDKPNKSLAFLAYLLSIVGCLYVLFFHRKEKFAVYHAKQSMMLAIVAVIAPVIWIVVAWGLVWIPLAGPLVAAALFSLVIATYLLLAVAWIIGMVYARQAQMKPLPVIGGWAERLFTGKVA
jgi:uncharacterized membrane protein